jgi:hypothetical protein
VFLNTSHIYFSVNAISEGENNRILNRDLVNFLHKNKYMQVVTSISSKNAIFQFLQQKLNGLIWTDQYINIVKK